MPLYIPKKVPLNWYKYEIELSIELLEVYISNVENQVNTNVEKYNKKKETEYSQKVIKILNDQDPSDVTVTHEGLDSMTLDLEIIFEEYFPSLQRRSALITLFGIFEHILNDLCILFQKTEDFKIGFKNIKGSGIDRSIEYLELVALLPIDKKIKCWQEIKSIQKIRNLAVHCDSELIDYHGNPRKNEQNIVQQNIFLEGVKEVILKEGYLSFVLKSFTALFKHIDELIQVK